MAGLLAPQVRITVARCCTTRLNIALMCHTAGRFLRHPERGYAAAAFGIVSNSTLSCPLTEMDNDITE